MTDEEILGLLSNSFREYQVGREQPVGPTVSPQPSTGPKTGSSPVTAVIPDIRRQPVVERGSGNWTTAALEIKHPPLVVSNAPDTYRYSRLWDEYISLYGHAPDRSMSLQDIERAVRDGWEEYREDQRAKREKERFETFTLEWTSDPYLMEALDELGISLREAFENPYLREQVIRQAIILYENAKQAYEAGEDTDEAKRYAKYIKGSYQTTKRYAEESYDYDEDDEEESYDYDEDDEGD